MKADLGADGDRWESTDGFDVDLMIHTRSEWGDEVGVGSVEGLATGNVGKEIFPYELILWAPDLPSLPVEDGVEVRVVRRRVSARQGSEKIWEKVEVVRDFVDGGRRLYGGGGDWGQAPNNVFGRGVTKGRSG